MCFHQMNRNCIDIHYVQSSRYCMCIQHFYHLLLNVASSMKKITLTACWCNTEFSGQNMFLIFIYNMLMVYFIANKLIEIFIASSWNLLKCILSDYIHVEDLTNIQVISIETSYAVTEIMCLCTLTFVL